MTTVADLEHPSPISTFPGSCPVAESATWTWDASELSPLSDTHHHPLYTSHTPASPHAMARKSLVVYIPRVHPCCTIQLERVGRHCMHQGKHGTFTMLLFRHVLVVSRCDVCGRRSRTPHEKRRIAKGVVHTAWMLSCRAMLCVPRWDDRQRLSEWQSVGPPGVAAASASQPVTGSTQRRPKMSRRASILRIGARPRLFC